MADTADVARWPAAPEQGAAADDYRAGQEAGLRWAARRAEPPELVRLEALRDRLPPAEWERCFQAARGQSVACFLARAVAADGGAEAFWRRAIGDGAHQQGRLDSGSYVRGFAEGALALWRVACEVM